MQYQTLKYQTLKAPEFQSHFLSFQTCLSWHKCFLLGLIWKSTNIIIFKVSNLPNWSQTPLPEASLPWAPEEPAWTLLGKSLVGLLRVLTVAREPWRWSSKIFDSLNRALGQADKFRADISSASLSYRLRGKWPGQVTEAEVLWRPLSLEESLLYFCLVVHSA